MNKLLSIGQASKALGVTIQTLRNWDNKEVEVIIINKGEESVKFEEELAKDVLEIITVFSARLYGSRSKKNKKLLDEMQEVVVENVSK
ncbi:hypothetical protein HEJ20_001731 [Campylobacter jejuni]|nr:hypothetical protein [Campylobacter jejuni]